MIFSLTACGKEEESDNGSYKSGDVTLGQYRGLEVEKQKVDISDDEILADIYAALYEASAGTEITSRKDVKLFDLLNIDYTGKKDGVAFEGGTAAGAELLIGSDAFIPGFESGLIGAKVGETVNLNLTFPEDYGNAALAGQAVVFEVKVNSITAIENLTDDIIAANTDYKTLDEYKSALRTELETTAENNATLMFETKLIETAIANATFNKDLTAEIEEYADYLYSTYEYYASQYGFDLTTYVYYMSYGTISTLEEFEAQMLDSAEYAIKREYMVMAIADEEGLEISEDEFAAGCDEYMREYAFETVDALLESYGEDAIREALLYDKAIAVIFDTAIAK